MKKFFEALFKKDKNEINVKLEIYGPLFLIIIILIFLAPMLFLREGINADDGAFQSFPKLMAIARAYQNGEIPLWDRNEFSGAKPFYIMLENPAYNIFHIPFYFLANLDNLDQSYYVLYILPFTLIVIFGGLGAYFLGRFYFRFSYILSILMGFMWAVNPSMALSTYSTVNTSVFAAMPWIVFTIAMFLESKKWQWWIAGVFSVAILNSSYTVNYPVRIYFVLGVMFLILSIWHIKNDKKNIKYVLFASLIVVGGVLMTSFVWAHIIEAAKYSKEQFKMTYNGIVDDIPNNMPPTHIITMFIPNFNGSLTNIHAWGDGMLIYSADRILTGGIFTSFCFVLALLILIYEKDWNITIDKKTRIWLIIGIIVNTLILAVMMAKYTPVYFILCALLPQLFLIPYPFYFHFAQHFSAIILIIYGLSLLIDHKKEILGNIHATLALTYVGFILLFVVVYMFVPVPSYKVEAYKFLTKYKEWEWFVTRPILYFIVASIVLISVYSTRKRKFNALKFTIIFAVLIESFSVGYLGFYRNMVMPRPMERDVYEKLQRPHYTLPSKNPYYKQVAELKKLVKENDSRWASDVTTTDGLSWVVDGRTLAGYDSKPVISNTRRILREFYKNFPYQLVALSYPKVLLNNLNVGHILAYNNKKEENLLYYYKSEDKRIEYYNIRSQKYIDSVIAGIYSDIYFRDLKDTVFKIHKLDKPMPYLYFQDKIFQAADAVQKEQLQKEDLRKFALVYPESKTGYSTFNPVEKPLLNTLEQFESLQQVNKITELDKKHYNKLTLKAEIVSPLILVRNETFHPDWKVFVDGKQEKLLQVNYLMQGVLLKPGSHDILFKFAPERMKTAGIISIITFIVAVLAFAALSFKDKFIKKTEVSEVKENKEKSKNHFKK